MRKLFSTMLLSLLLGPAAWAQTPHIWNLGIYDPTIDSKHALGTLQVHGRIFPAGTSLSALSPDPAVAVVGRFYAATAGADASGIMNAICPADQAAYDPTSDLEGGAD